jgi:hypothetical protein
LLSIGWKRPFANVDANVTESATLLCTLLVLILGLGSGTSDSDDSGAGPAQAGLNIAIYVTIACCISVAIFTLARRLIGALHSFRYSQDIAATEDRFHHRGDEAVPDEVREMLHKRKLQLTVAWIGLTDKQRSADGDNAMSKKLDMGRNVLPEYRIDGTTEIDKSNKTNFKFVATAERKICFEGEAENGCTLEYQPGAIEVCVNDRQLQDTEFIAHDGRSMKLALAAHVDDEVCITAFGRQFFPTARYCDLIDGGDQPLSNQQRMVRVFKSAKQYQKNERLEGRLKDFESIFPERLRPALYAWALQKDPKSRAHLMELKWFIDQLAEMEQEQHSILNSIPIVGSFLAACCTKQDDEEPEFLDEIDAERKEELFKQLKEHSQLDKRARKEQEAAIREEMQLTSKQFKLALEFAKNRVELTQAESEQSSIPRNSVAILNPTSWKEGDMQDPYALERGVSEEANDAQPNPDFNPRITMQHFRTGADLSTESNRSTHGAACARRLKKEAKASWNAAVLFFLGNTTRTSLSLLFALMSWWLMALCVIQWHIDTDDTLNKHGELHSKCTESRNVQAIWWIAYVCIYATFVIFLAPLIAAYYNSNDRPLFLPGGSRRNSARPLFLATRELGCPATDEDTGNFAPESEGGAYQVVRVALEHLKRYRDAMSYKPGAVIHVERELDGVKSIVRATIRGVSAHAVCVEYPDGTVGQNPWVSKSDLKMPTLELPSKSKRYDDSLQPETVLGRIDLKLSRVEANRLVEFVSLRRQSPRGQLVATVILDPNSDRLKDILDPETECLIEAREERRCTVSFHRGEDNSVKQQLNLEELMDLITGLSSIMPYEWLLFVSWLLTIAAIVLDSPTFRRSEDRSTSNHDEHLLQQLNDHKWIVRLLIYYCVVLCVYPTLKFMQDRGCLACLEPCADKIRSMKRGLLAAIALQLQPQQGPRWRRCLCGGACSRAAAADEIELGSLGGSVGDLSFASGPEPEPEQDMVLGMDRERELERRLRELEYKPKPQAEPQPEPEPELELGLTGGLYGGSE